MLVISVEGKGVHFTRFNGFNKLLSFFKTIRKLLALQSQFFHRHFLFHPVLLIVMPSALITLSLSFNVPINTFLGKGNCLISDGLKTMLCSLANSGFL